MPRKAGDAETSMFTRGRIIGMHEGGVPKMMISKTLNIDPKTIRKWILRYEAHGESGLKSIPKPGAHRKTTAFEDVAIAQAVAVTPTISAQEINKMLGLNISAHTIRRRVRDAKIRSRQEKKEGRLARKRNNTANCLAAESSTSPKKKVGVGVKKIRKKKQNQGNQQVDPNQQEQQQQQQQQQPQQQPQQQQQQQQQQQPQQQQQSQQGTQPQIHTIGIIKQTIPQVAVPVVENGVHQQFIGKIETIQAANLSHEPHIQFQTQYQTKQMPFYSFTPAPGYEFPRIWAPVTCVRNAYCEGPKLVEFAPAEITQLTHSSVQTTGFFNSSTSSPN